jgi:gas vesicle protein
MARRQVNRYFEGLLAGSIIGIFVGLLSATKPGTQFREELKVLYKDLSRNALDLFKELRQALIEPDTEGKTVIDHGKRLVDNFMGHDSGPVYTPSERKTGISK